MIEPNTRGEVTVHLDGCDFGIRPSFEAIEAVEKKLGKGLGLVFFEAANGRTTLSELAVIVCEFINAWGRAQQAAGVDDAVTRGAAGANADRVKRLIYEAGFDNVIGRVQVVLLGAVTGGVTASGEWKPATVTETPAAG